MSQRLEKAIHSPAVSRVVVKYTHPYPISGTRMEKNSQIKRHLLSFSTLLLSAILDATAAVQYRLTLLSQIISSLSFSFQVSEQH